MKKGFTLIELLVVVLIIGILAAIALPQYQVAVGKAKFMELMVLGDAVRKSEEMYYLANNTYTDDVSLLDLNIPEGSHISVLGLSGEGAYSSLRYTGLGPYYIIYFDHNSNNDYKGRRECRTSLTASNTEQQICASLTGSPRQSYNDCYYWVF